VGVAPRSAQSSSTVPAVFFTAVRSKKRFTP
jgi:hypothetical protein